MANFRRIESLQPASLNISKNTMEQQLRAQIQEGQRISNLSMSDWKDLKRAETEESSWVDYTVELLTRSFTNSEEGTKFSKFGKNVFEPNPDLQDEVKFFRARMDEAIAHLNSLCKRLSLIPECKELRESVAEAHLLSAPVRDMNLHQVARNDQVKPMTLKQRIEDSLIYWLLGTLLAGFLAGVGAYKGILEIAQLEIMSKPDKAQLTRENTQLKQENNELKQKVPHNDVELTVTYPIADQEIKEQETITGVWKNLPVEQEIWIVIYSHSDELFYPHSINASTDFAGKWVCPNTNIGGKGDSGKYFDIIALLAEKTAQQEFRRYAQNPESSGMKSLPKGIGIYRQVRVKRK